jgi:hypothetical protein
MVVWGLSSAQTMKVHSTVPCECRLTSEQNVRYKMWVYSAFCEKPLKGQEE